MISDNKSSLVTRLERNQHDIQKMKYTLSSYICEPRTPSLYERSESLKQKLENLRNTHGEVIQSLKNHKKVISTYVDRAKQQFQEFYLLQKGVADYVAGARNH